MRTVLHIELDSFFVSLEQARDPFLKGKPVIVGGDPGGLGVVAAASSEALAAGVHVGMTASAALSLCPKAVFLRGDDAFYLRESERFFSILSGYSPVVEAASMDGAYMDLTGLEKLMGPPAEIVESIRNELLFSMRLKSSFGLAANKLLARVGSATAGPDGLTIVRPGYEAAFLAPKSLESLPGVGPVILRKLKMFNIRFIGYLAALDPELLEATFGSAGRVLHQRANGFDDSPVIPSGSKPLSINREISFPEGALSASFLEMSLYQLAEKTAACLRREGLEARNITLNLRYADLVTCSRSTTLTSSTDLDTVIYEALLPMFRRLFTRRIAVGLLGVSLSRLTIGSSQLSLFENQRTERIRKLYKSIDSVREKFGFHALKSGRTILPPMEDNPLEAAWDQLGITRN